MVFGALLVLLVVHGSQIALQQFMVHDYRPFLLFGLWLLWPEALLVDLLAVHRLFHARWIQLGLIDLVQWLIDLIIADLKRVR